MAGPRGLASSWVLSRLSYEKAEAIAQRLAEYVQEVANPYDEANPWQAADSAGCPLFVGECLQDLRDRAEDEGEEFTTEGGEQITPDDFEDFDPWGKIQDAEKFGQACRSFSECVGCFWLYRADELRAAHFQALELEEEGKEEEAAQLMHRKR